MGLVCKLVARWQNSVGIEQRKTSLAKLILDVDEELKCDVILAVSFIDDLQ